MNYANYKDVPWYRKSGISSVLVLFGIFSPSLWIVLLALITGDIYYKETDQHGNLKKWSMPNKIFAWIIFIPNFVVVYFLLIYSILDYFS